MSEDLLETVLAESVALFTGLLDNELGGVYLYQDDLFTFVNHRFCDLFGYTQDEICGHLGPDILTAPEYLAVMRAQVDRRIAGETKTGHYVFRALRKDGTSFFAEVFGVRTLFRGRPAIVGILIDVNEQVLAERRAADHTKLLAQLMDTIPSPLFYKGTDGIYLGCNQAFETYFGLSKDQIVGKSVYDLCPEHLAPVYDDADRALFNNPGHQRYEAQVRDGAGTDRSVVFNKATFNRADGQVQGLIGVILDITDVKRVQQELRLAEEAFANSHQSIAVLDGQGVILKVNPAFTAISGFSADEVVGRVSSLFEAGDDPQGLALRRGALDKFGQWEGDCYGRRKDGTAIVEFVRITAVRDGADALHRHVVISSDVTLSRQYRQKIEHMALYDSLTNLANRAMLFDRMSHAIGRANRQSSLLGVCYLDLDAFKPINDSHGHDIGDRFLIEVARRLSAQMRGGDMVARLGGDEFVLLFENIVNESEIEPVLSRILAAVAAPYVDGEARMQATTSIGVALYPQDGQDPDTLVRHANQAMFAAKRSGKNRSQFFDAETDYNLQLKHHLLAEVRHGLDAGQFHLLYQPKVDLISGAVIGAEALIRWNHPDRGLLNPFDFLSALEDRSLSPVIGRWVMREALAQVSNWAPQGLILPVSINITASHLQQRSFVGDLRACLTQYADVDPSLIQIEILESMAIEDLGHAGQVVEQCARLGVSFALDDFGTGYSSLTYLRRMPVQVLKIDKSFVLHMLGNKDDMAIVEGVISLGRAFGRKVIAEGVETVDHGIALKRLGCDWAQGFGIARPMPAADMPQWVADWRMPAQWLA